MGASEIIWYRGVQSRQDNLMPDVAPAQRIFRYTDRLGWMLNFVALVTSIGSGAALPLMTLVFGSFINKFNRFEVRVTSGQLPRFPSTSI